MSPFDIRSVERPEPKLLTYYLLTALATGPGLLVVLPYLYFRYHTMRYHFDAQGISMSWGILFRREVHLTYARIQDIHLVSNVLERFLGLAKLQIQTASGSRGAEMTLEGLADVEAVRDYLYSRLRGGSEPTPAEGWEALKTELQGLTLDLRQLRQAMRKEAGRG